MKTRVCLKYFVHDCSIEIVKGIISLTFKILSNKKAEKVPSSPLGHILYQVNLTLRLVSYLYGISI